MQYSKKHQSSGKVEFHGPVNIFNVITVGKRATSIAHEQALDSSRVEISETVGCSNANDSSSSNQDKESNSAFSESCIENLLRMSYNKKERKPVKQYVKKKDFGFEQDQVS